MDLPFEVLAGGGLRIVPVPAPGEIPLLPAAVGTLRQLRVTGVSVVRHEGQVLFTLHPGCGSFAMTPAAAMRLIGDVRAAALDELGMGELYRQLCVEGGLPETN